MPLSNRSSTSEIVRVCRGSNPRVRNHMDWRDRLARMRGSSVELDLRSYDEPLAGIDALEGAVMKLPDGEIESRGRDVREQVAGGVPLDRVRNEFFALVREASRRALGLRPFDEQVVAALALDRGAIVEMQTGEGKTLAAVMPAALNALSGRGVHVLTFNDYLARTRRGVDGADLSPARALRRCRPARHAA